MEKIQLGFLDYLDPSVGSLGSLVARPEMFTLELKLRNQLLDFYEKTDKIINNLPAVKGITSKIINDQVKDQLLPHLRKKGLVKIETRKEKIIIDKWNGGISFSISLEKPNMGFSAPLIECALLKRNPIQYLEENNNVYEFSFQTWLTP